MYYLNTTRRLKIPATDASIDELMALLASDILPKASTLEGMRSISWMLSTDRQTLQAFSGWGSEADLQRAQDSTQHRENGVVINELLGGLTEPQGHSYYRLLSHNDIS